MAKEFDFAKATEDFFAAFKMDTKAFDEAFKHAAEFNVKLAKIALDATRKNVELTNAWTLETLSKLEGMNKVQKDVTAYGTAASEFAAAQAQAMPEKLAKYAEVAKAAQLETIELFVAASKDAQSKVVAATNDMASKVKAA